MKLIILRSIWQYRQFIFSSIRREIINRFTRSKLGVVWVIINPLSQVLIYALVLSNILAAKLPDIVNTYAYAIYLMAGLLGWNLFVEIINRCLMIFLKEAELIKKVRFPRVTLPIIVAGSSGINNILLFISILGIFALLGHEFGLVILWLIPLTLIVMAIAMAIGLIAGILNVFLRDVSQVMPIILQIWFWLTPIIYPVSIIPENYRYLLSFNPMYPIISSYQQVLVYNEAPQIDTLIGISIIAFVLMIFTFFLFRRASPEIVDLL